MGAKMVRLISSIVRLLVAAFAAYWIVVLGLLLIIFLAAA